MCKSNRTESKTIFLLNRTALKEGEHGQTFIITEQILNKRNHICSNILGYACNQYVTYCYVKNSLQ